MIVFEPLHGLVGFVDCHDRRRGRLAWRTNAESHHRQRRQAEDGAQGEDVVQTVDEGGVGMGNGPGTGEVSGAELGVTRDRVEGGNEDGESQTPHRAAGRH